MRIHSDVINAGDLSGQHKLHRWDYDGTGLACVCGAVSRRAQAEVAA